MTYRQLREWLARRLKLVAVPDDLWEILLDDGRVVPALEGNREDLADLLYFARRLLRFQGGGADRRARLEEQARPESVEADLTLGQSLGERVAVVSDYLARRASAMPQVRRFRREILGARILTAEEAYAFVRSPATVHLDRARFRRSGMPFVGHDIAFVRYDGPSEADIERAWGLRIARLRAGAGDADGSGDEADEVFVQRAVLRVGPDGEEVTAERRFTLWTKWETIAYPGEEGRWVRREAVWPGSVLDELRQLAAWLADRFGWQEGQASWFVLTGRSPLLTPLGITRNFRARRGFPEHHTLTLTVAPWVPAATVARAYRTAQRQLLGGRNRQPGARSLALFRFVTERMDERGRFPAWEALRAEWNRAHPEWRTEDRRQFAKDFRRVERALLFPGS
jgi:hypothetical protein